MLIYFLQFNSKINRIVKTFAKLDGYRSFIVIGPKDATNFPYADGVVARETYNFETENMPDYAVIVDDQENVISRWYIEQIHYTRKKQYTIDFRRDVLADFKEQVINATCLIEKATVSDNDPAIFNQEPITFNQIKKSEKLLKDKTGSAWLVGYLSSDNASEKTYTAAKSIQIQRTVAGIQNWEFYQYINNDFVGAPKDFSYNIKIGGSGVLMTYAFNAEGRAVTDTVTPLMGYSNLHPGDYAYDRLNTGNPQAYTIFSPNPKSGGGVYTPYEIAAELSTFLPDNCITYDSIFKSQVGDIKTEDEEGFFKTLNGNIIFDTSESKAYRVNVIQVSSDAVSRYTPVENSALWLAIKNDIASDATRVFYRGQPHGNQDDIYVKYVSNSYRLTLTEVDIDTVSCSITAARLLLNDAPYTMFAIPFQGTSFKIGANTYTSDPAAALAVARQISLELMSSGALYDLQLLPYCPRQDLVYDGGIDLRAGVVENVDYELIKDGDDNVKSVMIFAKESSFTFDINEAIQITEKKVQNQVDMWRLCSPNYNGVFEFNAAKNNGVDYFNVDCTYRPYNPYIHVNPNFKELYGNDYDDARGLICSGDFSMPASTDKWLEYEAQNKNYQQSFDRQIQHMEIEQKYQRIQQITGAVAGVGQGALMGGMIGGPIGAAVGGAASLAGGIADVVMGEKLRSEQIRYTKDQFTFGLENIKALPNTLAKVSAFNKNNKIFPFLEYYSCTDIERQAFRDTLTYDGMTVNRIGRIIDFLRDNELQYIRARLIRCDIHDDLHIVDTIATEMEKGAYYDTRSN